MEMLQCFHCGNNFEKELKEITRQQNLKGDNTPFFCSLSCYGHFRLTPLSLRLCPCGNQFETRTDSSHCSRSCTTKYTMTPERLLAIIAGSINTRFIAGSLNTADDGLRVREWNKYDAIHRFLWSLSILHLFEYHIPGTNYVYDLALFDMCVLVEFDEAHHRKAKAMISDKNKDMVAQQNGWNVCRIDTANQAIPYSPELMTPLMSFYD